MRVDAAAGRRPEKAPWRSLLAVGLLLYVSLAASAAPRPPKAAIASAHPLATAAGFEVLGAGGNAFDASMPRSR